MLDGCANPLPNSIVPPPMKLFTRIFKEKPANQETVLIAAQKNSMDTNPQKDADKPTFRLQAKLAAKPGSTETAQTNTKVSLRDVSLSKSKLSNIDLKGGDVSSPTKLIGYKPLRISRKLSHSKGTKIESQDAVTLSRRDSVEEGPGRIQTVITQQGASTLHKNLATTCTTAGSQIKIGRLDLNPSFRFIGKKADNSSRSILRTEISQLGGQIQNSLMTNTFKEKDILPEPKSQLPAGGTTLRPLMVPKSLGLLAASPNHGEQLRMSLQEKPPSLHALERPAPVRRRSARPRPSQKWVDPGSRVEDIIISFQKDL